MAGAMEPKSDKALQGYLRKGITGGYDSGMNKNITTHKAIKVTGYGQPAYEYRDFIIKRTQDGEWTWRNWKSKSTTLFGSSKSYTDHYFRTLTNAKAFVDSRIDGE